MVGLMGSLPVYCSANAARSRPEDWVFFHICDSSYTHQRGSKQPLGLGRHRANIWSLQCDREAFTLHSFLYLNGL
ncbi:hypothetical protein BD309DRAFT_947126 [Dichomitus squalens]|nr:hypothetical protein BD309DRAFT_947126 [Dichomitus squalens]